MLKKNRAVKSFENIRFYIIASIIGLLIVIPFYWMIITAIKTESAIFTYPIEWVPSEITLDNFASLFSRFPFGQVLLNSAIVTVGYTAVSLATCSMAAFAFAKIPFKGSETIFKLYLATLMIPFQSILVPLFLIFNGMGLSNNYLSVIIPSLFRVFGIFMLVQNIKTIPNDYIDAARLDGASYFTVLRKIVLPMITPVLGAYTVITFMDSWNDYLWPLVMLTKTDAMTLPVALSKLNGQFAHYYGVQMAGSLISIIPVVIVYLFAQRMFKSGLTLGGIKG